MATGRAASTARRASAKNKTSSSKTSSTKSSGSIDLKGNGAGYATRDRNGNVTYYKNSKDAAGYSDVGGTRDTQSKGTPMFTKDSAGKVITSEALQPVQPLKVPSLIAPTVPDYTANNPGLTGGQLGIKQEGSNLTLPPETQAAPSNDKYAGLKSIFDQYQAQASQLELPSAAKIRKQLERETDYRDLRQQVANYTSQLNTITSNRDANLLKVEGQGRGIPDVIIGGQQAQINKEAAIQALPVQAQLAAAQGNLELAQDHINTWGNILMQDATNKYNHKKALLDSVREFSTTIELKRIDDLNKAEERKYQEQQALIAAKTNALKMALGQNAPDSVKSAIMAATTQEGVVSAAGIYNGDVLARQIQQAQLRELNAPKGGGGGGYAAPTIKTINGVDYQWDAQNGKWVEVSVGGAANNPKLEQLKNTLSLARELRNGDAVGKSGAVGFSWQKLVPFGQSLGLQGDRTAFDNKVNSLKANLTLDNLKLLKGPMSDKDLAFLQSVGSSLSTNMSEAEFNKELDKVIIKLQGAQGYTAPTFKSNPNALPFTSVGLMQTGAIVAPDGAHIIIDD